MNYKQLTIHGNTLTVYEDGRIYKNLSVDRLGRKWKGRFISQSPNSSGYMRCPLCIQGKYKYPYVHRIMAEAFLENYQPHLEVDHIDGNISNNHISNLRMATRSQNLKGYRSLMGGTSRFRCVDYRPKQKNWTVRVCNNNRLKHIGVYNSEIKAAKAANEAMLANEYMPEALNNI
jgi:hypothetical protein